jgi:hypothetical protein
MKKPKGRPRRRKPKPGERVSLGLRVTPEMKEALDRAAAQSGRSQSQEAEFRIERTFADQRSLYDLLELTYGPKLAGIIRVVAEFTEAEGHHADMVSMQRNQGGPFREQWLRNPYAFDEAVKAANIALERFRPAGEISPPPPVTDEERQGKFWLLSLRRLLQSDPPHVALGQALDGNGPTPELRAWADSVRKQLGDLADTHRNYRRKS